jgi:hypothetical protein
LFLDRAARLTSWDLTGEPQPHAVADELRIETREESGYRMQLTLDGRTYGIPWDVQTKADALTEARARAADDVQIFNRTGRPVAEVAFIIEHWERATRLTRSDGLRWRVTPAA